MNNFFNLIHHVAIIVSEYEKSKDFYTRVLGLSIVNEEYRLDKQSYKLDLKLNQNIMLELFSFPNPPKRVSYPESCGLRHLAFGVSNVFEVVDYLEKQGVACEKVRIDQLTNKLFAFFNDPDGLPLELYQL